MSAYTSIFNPEDKLSEIREIEAEKAKSKIKIKSNIIDYDKSIRKIDDNIKDLEKSIKKHEELISNFLEEINKLNADKETLNRYKE